MDRFAEISCSLSARRAKATTQGGFAFVAARTTICPEPATFNFAAPEHAPLSDTYASLSDVFKVKIG
jgi:hypothetical protein